MSLKWITRLSQWLIIDEKPKAEAVETAVDQKDLKATIAAIYKFQQQVLHWSSSDGNIGGASSKTLAELNGSACTAEYVKQRIEQYPQVKAEREAKAAAEAKRKAEEAEAKRVALEKQKAEEERKEQMRKEPVENAKTYISNYGSDILALADAMKPYVGLNPQLVGAVLSKLGRMTRDNFTYALMNRLSDSELRNGGPELLGQMKSSLEAWFVSNTNYDKEIKTLDSILGNQKTQGSTADQIDTYFEKDRLTPEEIAEVRPLIASLNDEERQGYYLTLQEKVMYENQRDSQAISGKKRVESGSGGICNFASLAMVLQYLGVSNPYPDLQYEDALEKVRQENNYPARTTRGGWGAVSKKLGVENELLLGESKAMKKEWWNSTVKSKMSEGCGVMLSIQNHIVRLQAVTKEGLIVDDPYGKVNLSKRKKNKFRGGYEVYNKSEWKFGSEGETTSEGEDNLWKWNDVENYPMRWIASFKKI
ncbi:hypothetical protein [Persicobacter diffluens]